MTMNAATQNQVTTNDLRIERVTKEFGDVVAVDNVDITIGAGEFFSLLGPSGCGKTTTLRLVAGFEQPTKGRIMVGDDDLTPRRPAKRPLNMVFQDYALFPHLTVAENIAFGLRIKRLGKAEQTERIAEALRTMRLDGMAERRPAQLSGGQRQRVALARALVNRPRALLLDEPLGALDLKLRKQMQAELRRIHRQTGTTFLYVTHDQEEALTMSDRIAVMNDGHVEQLADPRELYERPISPFVADFIGTSNLLVMDAPVHTGTLVTNALQEGQRITARLPDASDAVPAAVQITVRPERISLHTAAPTGLSDADSLLRGTVTELVYLGSMTQVAVDLDIGPTLVVHALSDSPALPNISPGASVVVTWAPEGAHVIGAPS
ncbi:MAG TPA: ABC transporter ATP-binding protein [Actinomycetes bacterium]|nr:ABC transporter ATP-binding protein [Actinomycetes bacterium]